jgi:hypothetical protein
MIDERTLHEQLDAAVEGAAIDLQRLTARAERDGRRLRRRHRASAFAATSVLTAGVVLGVGWLAPDTVPGTLPGPVPGPATSRTPAATLDADVPQPATGRAAVAALTDLVGRLRTGTASEFRGQHTRPGALARGIPLVTVGELRWRPAGAGASVPVRVDVRGGWVSDRGGYFTCTDPSRSGCRVDERDGRVVVSYEKHTGAAVDRFVGVWFRDRGLRVVVATSNARAIEQDPTVLLAEPPLSSDDLRAVALDPVWGPTIAQRYVEAGQGLASYTDTGQP